MLLQRKANLVKYHRKYFISFWYVIDVYVPISSYNLNPVLSEKRLYRNLPLRGYVHKYTKRYATEYQQYVAPFSRFTNTICYSICTRIQSKIVQPIQKLLIWIWYTEYCKISLWGYISFKIVIFKIHFRLI